MHFFSKHSEIHFYYYFNVRNEEMRKEKKCIRKYVQKKKKRKRKGKSKQQTMRKRDDCRLQCNVPIK